MIGRAVDALRALPAVDQNAIARTVAAAARLRAGDTEPNEDDLGALPVSGRWTAPIRGIAVAASVVVALGIGLVVWRTARSPEASAPLATRPTSPVPSPSRTAMAPVISASASTDALESAPIPTQFVYDGPAHHVELVGDFNDWDEHATPLEREPGSALWSVTVPLQRGRHVYAFIVDSTWTTDRRAPASRDPDFGVEGSVIIVGRP
jgi:Glycogen recognition site of AMP-activated protein kinase